MDILKIYPTLHSTGLYFLKKPVKILCWPFGEGYRPRFRFRFFRKSRGSQTGFVDTGGRIITDVVETGGQADRGCDVIDICPEAEFLDVIWTKVLKVFLLAIHSRLY
jgi:hypothetical protein